jgi:hypothetical protein
MRKKQIRKKASTSMMLPTRIYSLEKINEIAEVNNFSLTQMNDNSIYIAVDEDADGFGAFYPIGFSENYAFELFFP